MLALILILLFQTRCRFDYAVIRARPRHCVDGDEGLVQSLVEMGDDFFQVVALLLDRQWIFGGYIVPPFCGITRFFEDYYGMATAHRMLNHNTLTYHNDS